MIPKTFASFALAISVLGFACIACSGGPTSTAPVSISAQDMKASDISRAKMFLDSIEKMPPQTRQMAASVPRTAEALKKGAAIDPATQQRIASLGITVK